jgi:hypothetical protein
MMNEEQIYALLMKDGKALAKEWAYLIFCALAEQENRPKTTAEILSAIRAQGRFLSEQDLTTFLAYAAIIQVVQEGAPGTWVFIAQP